MFIKFILNSLSGNPLPSVSLGQFLEIYNFYWVMFPCFFVNFVTLYWDLHVGKQSPLIAFMDLLFIGKDPDQLALLEILGSSQNISGAASSLGTYL